MVKLLADGRVRGASVWDPIDEALSAEAQEGQVQEEVARNDRIHFRPSASLYPSAVVEFNIW
jgi:hypothetical protein